MKYSNEYIFYMYSSSRFICGIPTYCEVFFYFFGLQARCGLKKPCLKKWPENICSLLFVKCCTELLRGCVIPLKSNIRRHLASHLALINSKRHFAEIMIGCIPSATPWSIKPAFVGSSFGKSWNSFPHIATLWCVIYVQGGFFFSVPK